VIGQLDEHAIAGQSRPEIEHADGSRTPLWPGTWPEARPGDVSIVDRCSGATLDVGSGPGRLTIALAERGIPALGIDIAPVAVRMTRTSGALALPRDVFGRVPGTGRWMTVLLADGSIGIGGDPVVLLRRIAELLAPAGQALVEIQPPGTEAHSEQVRLCHGDHTSPWFQWAHVGADQIAGIATSAGLALTETWTASGRWFGVLRQRVPDDIPDSPSVPDSPAALDSPSTPPPPRSSA
jgi:SAM-dependent methyltransferase